MTSINGSQALVQRYWPAREQAGMGGGALRALALIAFGSLFLAVMAQIKVPMWPVPITLQTFAILLLGLTYGFRLGTATILAHVAQGALGLPVFAGGAGGIAVLMGPTGGYIAGFVLAVVLTGWLADRGWSRRILPAIAALVIGNLAIYALGAGYLNTVFLGDWQKTLAVGVLPFLLGDALKIGLAVSVLQLGWRRRN
ncbi:MAG: biotin transporter BioY [Oceanibaculum nanhaiense]|uniref:biotin transporter BioY n=1 Tax=Oceanibaculum nanhaiense TaxID=1909734 RepID=UPI0025A47910|nr:biotin transporter BioY [Oceanibaculum nanhaiense]MDM7945955.1 biotin transporter BioY [Oceanibaculum nanhaiense]